MQDPNISIVLVWHRFIGNTQAHKVTSHPCSVGTAEVYPVNRRKGRNHGKDWDYAQINVAPSSLKYSTSEYMRVGVNITLSSVRTLVCTRQMLESLSFRKGLSRKRSIPFGSSLVLTTWKTWNEVSTRISICSTHQNNIPILPENHFEWHSLNKPYWEFSRAADNNKSKAYVKTAIKSCICRETERKLLLIGAVSQISGPGHAWRREEAQISSGAILTGRTTDQYRWL